MVSRVDYVYKCLHGLTPLCLIEVCRPVAVVPKTSTSLSCHGAPVSADNLHRTFVCSFVRQRCYVEQSARFTQRHCSVTVLFSQPL